MPPRSRAPKTPEEALSRALARTLRHAAKSQGISQDANGWCKLDDLLSKAPYTSMQATKESISAAVASDKKGRYELSEDGSAIRAVQGHSVEVDVGLKQLTAADIPNTIIHGTYLAAWDTIKNTGLSKMGRLHIHMASGLPKDKQVISGMRSSSEVYIYIDAAKAINDGIPFYQAKNGAILSSGIDGVIPPRYFEKVLASTGDILQ